MRSRPRNRDTLDHCLGSNRGRIPQLNLPGRCCYRGRDDRLVSTGSDYGNEDSVNARNCARLRRRASQPNQTSLAAPQLSGSPALSLARSDKLGAPCAEQPVHLHPPESTTTLDGFVHSGGDLRYLRHCMPMACVSSASPGITQSVRLAFEARRCDQRTVERAVNEIKSKLPAPVASQVAAGRAGDVSGVAGQASDMLKGKLGGGS